MSLACRHLLFLLTPLSSSLTRWRAGPWWGYPGFALRAYLDFNRPPISPVIIDDTIAIINIIAKREALLLQCRRTCGSFDHDMSNL